MRAPRQTKGASRPRQSAPPGPCNDSESKFIRSDHPILLAILITVYVAIIEIAYATLIAPRFGYMKYYYVEPNRIAMILSVAAHYASALTLAPRWKTATDSMSWLLLFFVTLPVATVPFYSGALDTLQALGISLLAALTLVVADRIWRRTPLGIPVMRRGGWWLTWMTAIGFSSVTYISMLLSTGISFDIHGLFDVYDQRLDYKNAIAGSSPIVAYLVSNQGNVINPLIMTLGAMRRNIPIVLVGILGQLVIYSATGFKTIFISVPVAVGLGWFLAKRSEPSSLLFFSAVNLVALATVIIDLVRDTALAQIFVNRLMVTSGFLTAVYVDYYSGRDKHAWSYSFLEGITAQSYLQPPATHLGRVYFGSNELSVNANLFADGFANWGVPGIVVEAAVLIVIGLLLNSASRGLPISIISAVLLLPIIALANGSPIEGLLSFGLLLSVVVLATIPRDLNQDDATICPPGLPVANAGPVHRRP